MHSLPSLRTAAARCSLLAALAALAAPALAQDGAFVVDANGEVTTRPTYRFIRHEEDWREFGRRLTRNHGAPHWSDALKNIESSPYVQLTFGGSAQARFESWSGFDFGPPAPADDSDSFLLTRARVHAEARIEDTQRVFLELKTAQATDRSLPGGRRGIDLDSLAIQELFYELEWEVDPSNALTFRAGRQMFAFGAQRLVSPLPWGNALRTWDGLALHWEREKVEVTGFYAQFVPVDPSSLNEKDPQNVIWGAYSTWKGADDRLGVDAYLLGTERDPRSVNGTTGKDQRLTVGLRAFGDLGGGFDLDVESATQTGDFGAASIDASMVAAQLGYRPRPNGPRFFAGFDAASGDESAGGDVNTFDPLFPLGHLFLGQADVIGRSNVIAGSVGVDHRFDRHWSGHASLHGFRLADTDDALYDAGGRVIIPGGAADSGAVGIELDLRARYDVDARTSFEAGLSHVLAGDALSDAGRDEDLFFFYFQASTRF